MGRYSKLVIAWLLLAFAGSSFASFSAPQVITYQWTAVGQTCTYVSRSSTISAQDACEKQAWAAWPAGPTNIVGTDTTCKSQQGACAETGYTSKVVLSTTQQCPENSTGTSSCTCDSGYQENSTQTACELIPPPPSVCEWASNLVMFATGTFQIERGKAACFNGCEFLLRPDTVALSSARLSSDSPWIDELTVGDFAGSGEVCDPLTTGASSGTSEPTPYPPGEDGVPPPDACPKDQVPGTVNGVTICVDPGIREVKSTTSSTNDDGTNTTEKIEDKQTTCVGEICTTTTTTVTNVTNNSTSTVTSSTNTGSETTTKGEYCKANPYDKLCTADGQGAASGDCSELDKGCTDKLGSLEPETFSNTNRAMSITAQSGWGEGAGSCPSPRVVNVAGITLEMPFDLLCEFAVGIRPIIIALAWLSAALAFLGLSKRD